MKLKQKNEIKNMQPGIISGCWNRYPSFSIVMVCTHAPTNKQSGCHKRVINTPRTYSFTRTHANSILHTQPHTHTQNQTCIEFFKINLICRLQIHSVTDSQNYSILFKLYFQPKEAFSLTLLVTSFKKLIERSQCVDEKQFLYLH